MILEPIRDTEPFIDLGFHTVTLNGKEIYRDEKGKKHGFSFPNNWQKVNTEQLNETSGRIGGLIPIELVAIDCDCEASYKLFKGLDPTNTAFMDSVGKLDKEGVEIKCGTILYKNSDSIMPSFRTTTSADYSIDFFNGTGMVFLPTERNKTKTTWLQCQDKGDICNHLEQVVEFKDMPDTVKRVLALLHTQPDKPKAISATKVAHKNRGFLAKALSKVDFTKGDYIPIVTKILTPYDYRDDKYKKQGHLHPNDIVGSGHMYLFKIASILAGDNTVDEKLFKDIINYINDLWDDPYPDKELNKSIINPILSESSRNNETGEPYWQYDPNWEDVAGYSVMTKRDGVAVDVFYDGKKWKYYTYSQTTGEITQVEEITKLTKHLRAISSEVIKTAQLEASCEDIYTDTQPTKDFGYYDDDRRFNLFKASEALKILHTPSIYEDRYKRPVEFINYIEHFIPEEEQRVFLLRFLYTKLLSFDYSPIVPYIIGVQGSGKNLLINVLSNILGKEYVHGDVSGTQFLEKYNDWLCDKYFVQLNEMAESLLDFRSQKQAQGILKNYTGAKEFEVRSMNSNYFTYAQTATFIMTANGYPLQVEDNDRRLLYISTPNTFDDSPQCKASDPTVVYNSIMSQTNDIAYYIATRFERLDGRQYIKAPDIAGRARMVFSSMSHSGRIAWGLARGEFELLEEFLIRPETIFADNDNDKLTLDAIKSAYGDFAKGNEDIDSIVKGVMKKEGLKLEVRGLTSYYMIPNLSNYHFKTDVEKVIIDTEAEDIRT